MTISTFEACGTTCSSTPLSWWRREQRAPGCSWLVGDAIAACVDDFGDLSCEFPSGDPATTEALIRSGFMPRLKATI